MPAGYQHQATKPDRGRSPGWLIPVTALAFGCAIAIGPPRVGAETLDGAWLAQAPQVIRYLKDHGHRNVGVLKFRVKKGGEPVSDQVGPLNLNLATRLEIALVLADDIEKPVGVIHDASAVAATIPGANHLTQPGRQVLFQAHYPLAWGDRQVEPDAFLTGDVTLSPDLRALTVSVLAFTRQGGTLDPVIEFTASADVPTLVESGESFRLSRGLFDAGKLEIGKVAETAASVKIARTKNPIVDTEAPVALEVYFDDRRVPIEIRDGKARLPEPGPGQKVAFVLRKVDAAPERYGVVLSVNDRNTLYKERSAPLQSPKWILGPTSPAVTVRGYQTAEQSAEEFRVLTQQESKKNVMNYGPNAGMVSLIVFREAKGRPAPPALDEEAEDRAVLARGSFPETKPLSLAALKFQLRAGGAGFETRGLIVQGPTIGAAMRRVEFRPDPTPVMAATINYHRP